MALKKIALLLLFAIAMAYLESAIVVYLRMLFYAGGFHFPMRVIPARVAAIEIGREAATLLMLWAVARISGKNFKERFALFCFAFGVWDLFYYFWLKLFINWPASWLEWDILFLIPQPWIAPWLAPALVSAGLILVSLTILVVRPQRFKETIFSIREWALVLFGGAIILASFFQQTGTILNGGIPAYFPWWLFIFGFTLGLAPFFQRLFRKTAS